MNAYNTLTKNDAVADGSLVENNMILVKRIAQHMAARLPSSVDIDDLLQSGMVGLLEAASNFDPSRGASFETYAGIRIRGAMLDDIRKHDWTPRSVHQKYRQVAEAINTIEAELGRPARSTDIAKQLGISVEDYHKILADSASSRLFSLEETLDESAIQRTRPVSDTASPDEELDQSQFRDELIAAIEQLPEREQLVISLYYEREMNLKEIGEVLDVTESRVCQIHGQAIMRMRAIASKW
jgi:RNA polymerase sigma factor for flagellar operon FliA